jgi:hypothetical protein
MSAARALQEAVFSALTGDAGLTALLGGARIHDGAPRNAAAPYLHLGEVSERDWSTATDHGAEVRFDVVAWSETPGRAQSLAIAGRAAEILHDAALDVPGYRLVSLRHLGTETAREKKPEGRRATARFRARLEAN